MRKIHWIILGLAFIIIAVLVMGYVFWPRPKPVTPKIMETATGQQLIIEDLKTGNGAQVKEGDSVTVNYVGLLTDGTQFDSSFVHGKPFIFTLGTGQVIEGWDKGLLGMKVGGKRKLTIPPDMAYGARGIGAIGPNATLIFEIDLLAATSSANP